MKKALVTGASGQDGHYLTQHLQTIGYEVYGMVRRTAQGHDLPDCQIVRADITDASAVARVVAEIQPAEIYNLAAQSHVGESFKCPAYTHQVNALGFLNILEAAKESGSAVYQASTSELFGDGASPQNEDTPLAPRSPYAVAKLSAYWMARNYREAYYMRVCNGILFNHESPRRGKDFVTQKVCRHVAELANRKHRRKLVLGNLDARRDWGHAADYVRAMHLMLQQETTGDYVVATGQSRSVRDLCFSAFAAAGLKWEDWVTSDASQFRPLDVPDLRGDPTKIKALGWEPKYTFHTMIQEMVDHAIRATA